MLCKMPLIMSSATFIHNGQIYNENDTYATQVTTVHETSTQLNTFKLSEGALLVAPWSKVISASAAFVHGMAYRCNEAE